MMHRSTHTVRWVSLLIAVFLTAGACSSSDDTAGESAAVDETSNDSGGSDEETSADSGGSDEEAESTGFALTCDEVGEPSALIRGANGWVGQVVDAESNELIGGDSEAVLVAIETLRPIQDVEGLFGTMREGLDNMEADITAIQEGRFDDKVGDYGIVTMNAVVGEEICGG